MQKVQGPNKPVDMSRLRRRGDLKTRVVDGETVVLDRQEGFIHQLNKTASYIWAQCDGQHTAAEIADRLCEAFEVEEPAALHDVLDVLKTLQDLKLLEKIE